MHVKEDAVIPYATAPSSELTFERSNVPDEGIFRHLPERSENAALVFRWDTTKLFLRALCDVEIPAHWRVVPELQIARP